VVFSAVDAGDGQKTSPKVRRKPRQAELRYPICVDRTGGSRNGPYFWNQRIKENTGIYIGLGFKIFGNTTYFIII
jgi:hypothetical protein